LVTGGFVDEPAEGGSNLRERLAGEGAEGENDLFDVRWDALYVDQDGLLVAVADRSAHEVDPVVADGGVVADGVLAEDTPPGWVPPPSGKRAAEAFRWISGEVSTGL
jgi:hypothetical protein